VKQSNKAAGQAIGLVIVLGLATGQVAWGVAWSLSGVIYFGTVARTRSTLESQAVLSCLSFFGQLESNCVFTGSHSMTDTVNFLPIANASALIVLQPTWSHYESAAGVENTCYNAYLQGSLTSTGETWQWWKGAICIPPSVPDKPPPTDCPVIIDLDNHGFQLTGLEDPVRFDLDASGPAEEIGWTAAGVHNGFLCLDRNHDGAITDGRELFGQVTPLANGQPAKIGYAAMAELDRPALGGNGDGVIDPEDTAFQDLCVWVDSNHDGVSQPEEILTLQEAGIVRLSYDYIETRRQDSHGNLFRYKSKAWGLNPAGRVRELTTYDVFFVQR
jgi:hypothetical protein